MALLLKSVIRSRRLRQRTELLAQRPVHRAIRARRPLLVARVQGFGLLHQVALWFVLRRQLKPAMLLPLDLRQLVLRVR